MTWFVFDMDDGMLGAHPTRKAAVDAHNDAEVLRRYCAGPGCYDYVFGYPGEDNTDSVFIETEPAARSNGFEDLVDAWRLAGCPMGRFDDPIAAEEVDA